MPCLGEQASVHCRPDKEKLEYAYTKATVAEMTAELKEIMNLCDATGDKHMQWFSKLIKEHFNGMVARAKFQNLKRPDRGNQQQD